MNKLRGVKRETWIEIFFYGFLFVFYMMWVRIQPLNSSPDENMRYQIAKYIYEHGSIPKGNDPAVRDAVWGISYAFSPVLSYMVSAVFMKLVSFFTVAPFALVLAARMPGVLYGLGTAFFTMRIGKKLFDERKAWVMTIFVSLLPGALFVYTYVNTDAMALLSTAMIVYAWVLGIHEGWSSRNCVFLSVGISICALSYYNAYGFILCSILLFGGSLLAECSRQKDFRPFIHKGTLVCVLVLAFIGWWFIRSYILYGGDITGRTASALCAEKYAMPGFKPSDKSTPLSEGWSLLDMLNNGFGGTTISWVELVSRSFVGRFGSLDIVMPTWLENNYLDFIKAGFILAFIHPVKMFALKTKKADKRQDIWRTEGFFNCCMMLALIIPNLLSMYYSYTSDYQPQGRYVLSMIIPLAYFMVTGYGNLLDGLISNKRVRYRIYTIFCCLLVVTSVYAYLAVFWPAYMDVPFSIKAFLAGIE